LSKGAFGVIESIRLTREGQFAGRSVCEFPFGGHSCQKVVHVFLDAKLRFSVHFLGANMGKFAVAHKLLWKKIMKWRKGEKFREIVNSVETITRTTKSIYLFNNHIQCSLISGVILIKKAGDGSNKIKGCWDSIHVVEVQEKSTGRNAHYKLTSTAMLWLQTHKLGSGTMNLGGSLTRQVCILLLKLSSAKM